MNSLANSSSHPTSQQDLISRLQQENNQLKIISTEFKRKYADLKKRCRKYEKKLARWEIKKDKLRKVRKFLSRIYPSDEEDDDDDMSDDASSGTGDPVSRRTSNGNSSHMGSLPPRPGSATGFGPGSSLKPSFTRQDYERTLALAASQGGLSGNESSSSIEMDRMRPASSSVQSSSAVASNSSSLNGKSSTFAGPATIKRLRKEGGIIASTRSTSHLNGNSTLRHSDDDAKNKPPRKRVKLANPLVSGNVDDEAPCSVCGAVVEEEDNVMIFCDGCNLCVHQSCYGIENIPRGSWFCAPCKALLPRESARHVECPFCPARGGALKPLDKPFMKNGKTFKYAHILCRNFIHELYFGDLETMEPIMGSETVNTNRWKLPCTICKSRKGGAPIQCNARRCATSYHVTCASRSPDVLMMGLSGASFTGGFELKTFCLKHREDGEEQKEMSEEPAMMYGVAARYSKI